MENEEIKIEEYTKYEVARVIGARALQISMGAPVLLKDLKGRTDTLKIATFEFEEGATPITIRRTMPQRL